VHLIIKLIFFILLYSAAGNTFAWGNYGHRVICELAWRDMPKATRWKADLLARQMAFSSFKTACYWADQIRDQPEYLWLKQVHFINQPRDAAQLELDGYCKADGAQPTCVVTGIEYFATRLKNSTTTKAKAEALLLLAHFVGDIHQPLHVAYAHDHGGNGAPIMLLDQKTNLHYLWDTGILIAAYRVTPARRALALNHAITAKQRSSWRAQQDIVDWASESLAISRQIYAKTRPKIDNEYLAYFRPIAERRLKQAGMRLSFLLQQLL